MSAAPGRRHELQRQRTTRLLAADDSRFKTPFPRHDVAWLWQVMRPWAVPIVRLALRTRVEGKHNVPRKGAAILASNHLSALDHVVLPSVTRRTIINISKAEHFQKPIKAWFFRQWGIIKLQRGASDRAAMDAAKRALGEGNLLCIYP